MALLALPLAALADQQQVDYDTSTPAADHTKALGNITAGTFVTVSVPVTISYSGGNHLAVGTTVTFVNNAGYNPGGLPADWIVGSTTATIPAGWSSGSVVSGIAQVSFTAPSVAGSYNYTAKWTTTTDYGNLLTGTPNVVITLTVPGTTPPVIPVTVLDTTPPVITGTPASQTLEATGPGGATATYANPTATDIVDGSVVVNCTPASGSTFALGTTTVTCTATDAAGNSASTSFTVTVLDTTPPALTVPANITVAATGPSGAVVTFSATATDLVDPNPAVNCTPASGSAFALGTTTVTCTATDAAGNSAASSFTVTVAYVFCGFKQPLLTPVQSYKAGSTIPVKFCLAYAGGQSVSTAVVTVYANGVLQGTARYDATDQQYIYNMQTKGMAIGPLTISVKPGDGSTHSIGVALK